MFSSVEDEDKLSACPQVNEARTGTPMLSYVISYVRFMEPGVPGLIQKESIILISDFRIHSYQICTELTGT